jgi:hypothetical protein
MSQDKADPKEPGSPFGHYGYLGEAQLEWFKRKLDDAAAKGWLRIGLVHHNALRKAKDDDGEPEDLLAQVMASCRVRDESRRVQTARVRGQGPWGDHGRVTDPARGTYLLGVHEGPLTNVVHRALVCHSTGTIGLDDLPPHVPAHARSRRSGAPVPARRSLGTVLLAGGRAAASPRDTTCVPKFTELPAE